MCDGIVVDGHIMSEARDELVLKSGILYDIVTWIINNCGIAMTPYIKTHWQSLCGRDQYFWEWYTNQVYTKHIHPIPDDHLEHKKWQYIRKSFSLPSDPFIRAYIDCAYNTSEPRYILAEDIFFYEPKAKRSTTRTQEIIKLKRSGTLCRHLQKELSIRVETPTDCESHFSTNIPACQNNTHSGTRCSLV